MFVIDFAPHLPKKNYPVRNVRISPGSATLAATFGKEGRAEHAAWWSLSDGTLIGTSALALPKRLREYFAPNHLIEPSFASDLSLCAIHGCEQINNNEASQHVVIVNPGASHEEGVSLFLDGDVADAAGVTASVFTLDRRWLLATVGRGWMCRWDLAKIDFASDDNYRPKDGLEADLSEDGIRDGVIFNHGEHLTLFPEGEEDSGSADESALAVTSDGKRLATGCVDGTVRLYDIESWKLLATVREGTGAVQSWGKTFPKSSVRRLHFSPDDLRLASWQDGRVTISTVTGEPMWATLEVTDLTDMAFTPDGKRLLTGGLDNLVRVWDTATWKEVARYDWKIGPIHSVTVSPDGAIAAAGGDKSRIVVWDLDG